MNYSRVCTYCRSEPRHHLQIHLEPPWADINCGQKALLIPLATPILMLHYNSQHAGFCPGKTTGSLLQSGKGWSSLSYVFVDVGQIWGIIINSTTVFCFLTDFPKPVLWHATSEVWPKPKRLMITWSCVVCHVHVENTQIFSTNRFIYFLEH